METNDKRITVHIRDDLYRCLRQEAYEQNTTQRAIIELALKRHFGIPEEDE